MALTHVCIWESGVGYRRVGIDEACRMYPYGASARSGCFVCELCAANVLLTAPGANVQHFRHDPAAPNKKCDERQAYFDPSYGRKIHGLNSHVMPLRIVLTPFDFQFQIGFFFPKSESIFCDQIIVADYAHNQFTFSFERIENSGTTYLDVGTVPSKEYVITYKNPSASLKKYWTDRVDGIRSGGSFIDKVSGTILQSGSKAYAWNTYYLLKQSPIYSPSADVDVVEICRRQEAPCVTWYLYQVQVKSFSAEAARFFLRYSIFLTDRPTKFYPVWPPYKQDAYFIYHNSDKVYFYLCGDDAELKSFPKTTGVHSTKDGRLYRLDAKDREQLVSFGKGGALGFSYLIKQPLRTTSLLPTVSIKDASGNLLDSSEYSSLPKSKFVTISCVYDGRVIIYKNNRAIHIYKLPANENITVDALSMGMSLQVFVGNDSIRILSFVKKQEGGNYEEKDSALFSQLTTCTGNTVAVPHSFANLASKYKNYPKVQKWLYRSIKAGQMPYSAYRMLLTHIPK